MPKRLTQVSRMLRNNATPMERRLWQNLKNRQLDDCRFRRQHPIGDYIVDFVCLERKIVVELDGSQHGTETSKDVERDAWLADRGFRVLRFWNHEVKENVDGVVATIRDALIPPPQPLPTCEGND